MAGRQADNRVICILSVRVFVRSNKDIEIMSEHPLPVAYRKLAAAVVMNAVETLARRVSDSEENEVYRLHLEGIPATRIAHKVGRPIGTVRKMVDRLGPDARRFLLSGDNPFIEYCGVDTACLRRFVEDIEAMPTQADIVLGRIRKYAKHVQGG